MAYTTDLTSGFGTVMPSSGGGKLYVLQKYVDFSVTANNLAQNETMCLFHIPAGVLAREVGMWVITADADVSDVDIGYATTSGTVAEADSFVDGATLAATGWIRDVLGETFSFNGTAGFVYTAEWDIVLTNKDTDTINGAKILFYVIAIDLREQTDQF